MKPQTAILKLRLRLNKLHSSDYDNIADWVAVEAVNKAGLEITRRSIKGLNSLQASAEETVFQIDDLQFLVKTQKLQGQNHKRYFESGTLPSDYLAYVRLTPYCSTETCNTVPLDSRLREEANAEVLLQDWSHKPSLEWNQGFHTLAGNRVKVYHDGAFYVDHVDLTYYRKPKRMDIHGYVHEDGTDSRNQDLEFPDPLAEIIIDYAAAVLAGDMESASQYQVTKGRAEENT